VLGGVRQGTELLGRAFSRGPGTGEIGEYRRERPAGWIGLPGILLNPIGECLGIDQLIAEHPSRQDLALNRTAGSRSARSYVREIEVTDCSGPNRRQRRGVVQQVGRHDVWIRDV